MAGKNGLIVITGCSGRIGLRLIEQLKENYQIVGFDVVPPKKFSESVDFQRIDLSSDASVKEGFTYIAGKYGKHIDAFIHLAAYYSFSKGEPEKYDNITVRGTGRLIENLQSFICEQFIFSSTQLVQKTCEPGEKVNENSPLDAKWDYPRSKIETEKLLHEKRGNIPVVILRIAGCYDDQCSSIPISNQIQRIYEKQLIAHLFPGDTSHGQPFLHFDDLIDAFLLCVNKRKELPPEVTLLIGEGKTYGYGEIDNAISVELFGKEISHIRIPKWFAKIGAWTQNHAPFMEKSFVQPWMVDLADDNCAIDITKAKTVLGWVPKHDVLATIPKMIAFLKKDPEGFYALNGLKYPCAKK